MVNHSASRAGSDLVEKAHCETCEAFLGGHFQEVQNPFPMKEPRKERTLELIPIDGYSKY